MSETPTTSNLVTRRASERIKPQFKLPTDRLSMEKQKAVLKAFVVGGQGGTQPVSNSKLSTLTRIAEVTVPLNNAFFESVGLITRAGRGLYMATEPTREYVRASSFKEDAAGRTLADTFADTWFFAAVRDRLNMAPATKSEMIEVLAQVASTDSSYGPQIAFLLDWLEYAELIRFDGEQVILNAEKKYAVLISPKDEPKSAIVTPEPAVAEGKKPTTVALDSPSAVLAISFELALTNDDLEKLMAEQIHALFTGVGQIASIKAALSK